MDYLVANVPPKDGRLIVSCESEGCHTVLRVTSAVQDAGEAEAEERVRRVEDRLVLQIAYGTEIRNVLSLCTRCNLNEARENWEGRAANLGWDESCQDGGGCTRTKSYLGLAQEDGSVLGSDGDCAIYRVRSRLSLNVSNLIAYL